MPVLVDLHQQHKQMMRDFIFRLVKLPQPCTDGLLHNAAKRCGLMRRPFAVGRLRHADTVPVSPVPVTEDALRRLIPQAAAPSIAEGGLRNGSLRQPNAGITSLENSSTECCASASVMSPKASQGTK